MTSFSLDIKVIFLYFLSKKLIIDEKLQYKNFLTVNLDKWWPWNSTSKSLNFYVLFLLIMFTNYADYPLVEDRMLDGFVPLKNAHTNYAFKKYMKSNQLLGDVYESLMRKQRVVACVERILVACTDDQEKAEAMSFLVLNRSPNAESKFKVSSACPVSAGVETRPSTELGEVKSEDTKAVASAPKEAEQPRKRRQNVAMSSLMNANVAKSVQEVVKPAVEKETVPLNGSQISTQAWVMPIYLIQMSNSPVLHYI